MSDEDQAASALVKVEEEDEDQEYPAEIDGKRDHIKLG